MKSILTLIFGLTLIFMGAIALAWFMEPRKAHVAEETPSKALEPEVSKTAESIREDRQSRFLTHALKSPETLAALEDSRRLDLEVTMSSHVQNPTIEEPSAEHESDLALEEPTTEDSATPDLTTEPFQAVLPSQMLEDFVSMRKEAIRNPDSPEIRAIIETIITKRKRRLGQEGEGDL